MVGSTLIYEPDETKLIGMDIEELDEFNIVELDSLITLDFETITQEGGVSWSEGEPVYYSEDSGMAVLRVSEAGLNCVCNYTGALDQVKKEDQEKLREFVNKYGNSNVFELATF